MLASEFLIHVLSVVNMGKSKDVSCVLSETMNYMKDKFHVWWSFVLTENLMFQCYIYYNMSDSICNRAELVDRNLEISSGKEYVHETVSTLLDRFNVKRDVMVSAFENKWGNFVLCSGVCTHWINGVRTLLKPCNFLLEVLTKEVWDENMLFIFESSLIGCEIVNKNLNVCYDRKNYLSVLKEHASECMNKIISEELQEGIISISDAKPTCIHSLGAVPKDKGTTIRCITDASKPDGISINNFMNEVVEKFSYVTVKDIAKEMTLFCYMSVLDIKGAYRSIPVCAEHRQFQGFRWEIAGKMEYLINNSLAFGLSSAPYLFTQFTEFVVRCMNRRGFDRVFGYLDDFLIMEETQELCKIALESLMKLLRSLGFYLNYTKLITPSQVIRYLGIDLNSVEMKLYLPKDKLGKLSGLVKEYLIKDSCTKLDLQQLVGVLSHCSTIIRGGRTFSRRAINLINTVPNQGDKIKLGSLFKEDLRWWKAFSLMFNGKAAVIKLDYDNCVTMYADASMLGFGASFGKDWFYGTWDNVPVEGFVYPNHFEKGPLEILYSSAERELWPILLSCIRWGKMWRNRAIHVFTDNTAVEVMLRTGRSGNKLCMDWLREIFWCSFVYNFEIFAHRISSAENIFCDALSRVKGKVAKLKVLEYAESREVCCLSSPECSVKC